MRLGASSADTVCSGFGVRVWSTWATVVVLLVGVSGVGAAQSSWPGSVGATGATESDVPAWSPLHRIGDLTRPEFQGVDDAVPELLSDLPSRVGLVWTAGNPAGLATLEAPGRADFRLGLGGRSGDYRRPLDPGRTSDFSATARAWGSLGDRGAGVGQVAFDRVSLASGAFANVLNPYRSSPLSVADTLGDPVTRSGARLAGAGGWRVTDRLSVGLGLGYAAQETQTEPTPVPRKTQTAFPGATLGLGYRMGGENGLVLSLLGRWQEQAHTVQVFSVAAGSRVYEFFGYQDPTPIDLVSTLYRRRIERDAWAVGGGAAGSAGQGRWLVHAELERGNERRFNEFSNDPIIEPWEANGGRIVAAIQQPIGPSGGLTLRAQYRQVSGEHAKPNVQRVTFRVDEEQLAGGGELRLRLATGWWGAVRVEVVHDSRAAIDELVLARSDLSAWDLSGGFQVARRLGNRFSVGLGGGVALHRPSGSLPNPAAMDSVYQKWIGPALGHYRTAATGASLTGTFRWEAGAATSLWIRSTYRSASPSDQTGSVLLRPPAGTRERWSLEMGVGLGPPVKMVTGI